MLFFNCASGKEVRSSTKFHEPLNFLITIILGVLGAHYQGLGISPLKEHGAIMLLFIMIVVQHCIFGDKRRTSKRKLPAHVQVSLCHLCDSCMWVPFFNPCWSLKAAHHKFMWNSRRAYTSLQIYQHLTHPVICSIKFIKHSTTLVWLARWRNNKIKTMVMLVVNAL